MTDPETSLNLGYTARSGHLQEGASARADVGKGMSAAAAQIARPATPPPAPVDRGGARKKPSAGS
jgi:hypothetical protein